MKTHYLLFLLTLFIAWSLASPVYGQRKKDNDQVLRDVVEAGSGAITQGDIVVGYFALFGFGRVNDGKQDYRLRLFNTEFESIHDHDLRMPQSTFAIDMQYNGQAICLLSTKEYGSELFLNTFSLDGQKLNDCTLELNSIEKEVLGGVQRNEPLGSKALLRAIPNKGFLIIGRDNLKKSSPYRMRFLSTSLEKIWDYSGKIENSKGQNALSLLITEDLLINQLYVYAKGRKARTVIEAVRIDDGALIFRHEPEIKEASLLQEFAFVDSSDDTFIFAGSALESGVRPYRDEGTGIGFRRVSKEGKLIDYKTIPYEEIAKSLGEQGKIHVEKGEFLLHRVIPTPNGGVLAIIEPYLLGDTNNSTSKKPTKWWPKSYLGLGGFEDIALVSFNREFEVTDAKTIFSNRPYGKINYHEVLDRPAGGEGFRSRFAVKFVQSIPEEKAFVIGIKRYLSKEDEDGEYVVVSDFGEGLTEKVIPSRDDATSIDYLIGKPGYILVLESLSDGSLKTRLEPVD